MEAQSCPIIHKVSKKDDAQLERNWIHDASTKRQYFFNVDECGQFGTVEAKRLEQRWKREKFKHS
jgi:hypothetical protein